MFVEVSKDLYGNQAKNLSESIFNIFDEDQSGHIDFVEYMMVSFIEWSWYFKAYISNIL